MTNRGASIDGDAPANRAGEGGPSPTAPLFRKADWWVESIPLDVARGIVAACHYARGASNTAVYCHGLMPRESMWVHDISGVAWWLPPTKWAALSAAKIAGIQCEWQGVLALSRLVIRPGVPSNACSFLIRHSMRLIDRKTWPLLLTYADGWRGHEGTIYKASGWVEAGETTAEPCYVREGRMMSRKAGPKTRTHAEMLALGCECVGRFRKKRFLHWEAT